MDDQRREELITLWDEETERSWRDDLTPEEQDFVASLDDEYRRPPWKICRGANIMRRVRKEYPPREIAELYFVAGRVRLRLRDGSLYNVHIGPDQELVYQAIDVVC